MKILVTLDGSPFAESVLEPVVTLAASSGAEVHLVEVVKESEARSAFTGAASTLPHPPAEGAMAGELGGMVSESLARVPAETQVQAQERLRQQTEDYLDHISERFFSGGAQRAVLWGEDAAEEIIDYAGKQKVDLIAIATHGRTGLARMLMGSVASKLLQARAAPLFMVRPEALNE